MRLYIIFFSSLLATASLCAQSGCTDLEACNYDALALVNDGTCCYGSCYTLSFSLPNSDPGLYWSIYKGFSFDSLRYSGGDEASMELCLENGCYMFFMAHESNTTWGENTYTLTDEDGQIVQTGSLDEPHEPLIMGQALDFWNLGMDDCFFGCDDPAACNFNPDVNFNDDSCIYSGCGCTDPAACNYDETALVGIDICCYGPCYEVLAQSATSENTWSIFDGSELVATSAESGKFCLEAGCHRLEYTYSSLAETEIVYVVDSGGLLVASSPVPSASDALSGEIYFSTGETPCLSGCIEPEACNYVENADLPAASCCYENCFLLDVFGQGDPSGVAWRIKDEEQNVLAEGSGLIEQHQLCLPLSCLTFEMIDETGNAWDEISYSIEDLEGNEWAAGSLAAAEYGDLIFRGVDLLSVSEEDCGTVGCTIPSACNYNFEAVFDPGICDFQSCYCPSENSWYFELDAGPLEGESFTYTIQDSNDAILYSHEVMLEEDSVQHDTVFCLPDIDDCMRIVVDATSPFADVSWNLYNGSGSLITSFNEQWLNLYQPALFDPGGEPCTFGCNDESACNYEALADANDENCCYATCLELKINPAYVLLIGSVTTESANQTILGASNTSFCSTEDCYLMDLTFVPTLQLEESPIDYLFQIVNSSDSIVYSKPLADVDSTALSLNVVDALFLATASCFEGCTDPVACNYSEPVYTEDGSCVYEPISVAILQQVGDSICIGDAVTFYPTPQVSGTTWFYNGEPLGEGVVNLYLDFFDPGVHTISVSGTVINCISEASTTITVLESNANFTLSEGGLLLANEGSGYQWFFDGIPLEGAVNQSLDPEENGSYQVQVFNELGCSAISDAQFVNSVSEGKPSLFTLFPNPSSEYITVESTELAVAKPYTIYDYTGRLVLNGMLTNGKQLGIQELPRGPYTLVIENHALRFEKM